LPGFLHQRRNLDALGSDAPESRCRFQGMSAGWSGKMMGMALNRAILPWENGRRAGLSARKFAGDDG
jgi:hypothetical protein